MKFDEYLNFLLDVGINYQIYRRFPSIFFANCIGGSSIAIIKDLDLLINKPAKKFTKRDWMGAWWVTTIVKGAKK